jgi:hypothetical protein
LECTRDVHRAIGCHGHAVPGIYDFAHRICPLPD